jgi:fructose-bisphosphate aldolase class II
MLANLNDVLLPAQKGKYGVGLFNAVNAEMARGVIGAAEQLRSPVIVGTAEIFIKYASLENVADLLVPMARRATVPVVVHYDHGLTFEKCMEALKLGFTSVMYDCSTDSYEENVRKVAELVRIAHALGATVEAELGHVGDNEDSAEGSSDFSDPTKYYTDPAQAQDYVTGTGADALAVSVGTAHGTYKLPPKLDFERIQTIAKRIGTPLVLHGGSGLTDEDFKRAIAAGISKINVFTEINVTGAAAMRKAFDEGKTTMLELMTVQIEAIERLVKEKILLYGSANQV